MIDAKTDGLTFAIPSQNTPWFYITKKQALSFEGHGFFVILIPVNSTLQNGNSIGWSNKSQV